MTTDVMPLAAFLIGVLGSTHCIAMCGGVVGAFTAGVPAAAGSARSLAPYLLAYNVGRIASYSAAGALFGLVGSHVFGAGPATSAGAVGRAISAGFTVLLGLYFTDLWRALGALERLGGNLWKRIEPFGRALLPVDHPGKAVLFGAIWGWLPCGMVYSTLAWSLTAGSASGGALLMASFGVGTLPMVLAMGAATRWLTGGGRLLVARRIIGWLLILFGLYLLFAPVAHIH